MTTTTTPGPSLPPPHFSLLLAKAIRQQMLFLPAAKTSRQERQRYLLPAAPELGSRRAWTQRPAVGSCLGGQPPPQPAGSTFESGAQNI